MLIPYKADLHIHTALSPCAGSEMTPPKIIHGARAKGLNIIAVTDHNTCANTKAVVEAATNSGITVIPGMEVQTREEVHLICLFPDIKTAMTWQDTVYNNLPDILNKREIFGCQYIFDKDGRIISEEKRLLLTATSLTVEKVIYEVLSLGGICYPAHIDRPTYSIIASLGFIPPELPVSTVEISCQFYAEEVKFFIPSIKDYNIIGSSDAHCLTDIGSQSTNIFLKGDASFKELALALKGLEGRKVVPRVKEISMHIIDIIQNSIEAGASSINVTITENQENDLFRIEIADNGRGMDEKLKAQVIDPFFTTRTTRRIGLGLPLLKAAAERCNGKMVIESKPGKGTRVTATFQCSHIDRAPLGNIVDSIVNTVVGYPELDLTFTHKIDGRTLIFDSAELRRELEDVPLNNPAVIDWIKNYLIEGYKDLNK